MKTPLYYKKYRLLTTRYSTRTWWQALLVWLKFDILPYFKKIDFIYHKTDITFYRWQTPFVKNSVKCIALDKNNKQTQPRNRWYQCIG